jgi:CBS domain containing-hemolysin-like protein
MFAVAVALVAVAGLWLLARLEGGLHARDSSGDAPPAHQAHRPPSADLIHMTFAALSVFAGGLFALALEDEPFSRLPELIAAPLIGVVVMVLVMQTVVASARRAAAAPHPAATTGAIPVLGPAVDVIRRLGAGLARATARTHDVDERDQAPEQFSRVISSEAVLTKDEEKLIRGAISLPRIAVRDVMVPRLGVLGVEAGTPWSEVLDRVRSSEHSRLPVYRDSLDDVTGILVAKDLLPAALSGESPIEGWEKLARPASFVPETRAVAAQLREFRNSRTHLAVVVDEYGGTAGILTIEDVLEELVGEIRDEHDVEEQPIVAENGFRFWVSGRVPIEELEEMLGETLPHEQSTSVGGVVYEILGRVPRLGEEFAWGKLRVVVERMKRHAVERVYIERADPAGNAE